MMAITLASPFDGVQVLRSSEPLTRALSSQAAAVGVASGYASRANQDFIEYSEAASSGRVATVALAGILVLASTLRPPRRLRRRPRQGQAATSQRSSQGKVRLHAVAITKPDTHNRTYSYIKLENGLQAIIGSDPECDKAGGALCVNVGMCHERKDLPGLAHFLEHMLFTGTEKYPKEGEFSEFIQQNGGSSNAYTACYFTNYMFDIKPDALEPALDRFSRFFSEPKLTKDCTEREINAVDSEFQGGFTEPWWRFIGIMNDSANPEHPFHVAVGNNKVLLEDPKERGIDLYDEMTKLYNDTYSANGMTVCVFGKQSTAELEELVRQKFSAVPDKGLTMPVGDSVSDKPAFLPNEWNRYLLQTPVKDIKEFTFSWVIPYQDDLWRTKPTAYITHLLGHEGTGSIAAALKELGLISGCYVGNGAWLEGAFSLLNVTFDLTDEGLNQLDVIGQHLFAYLGMLQASPPEKRIFDEMAKLAEIQFKFAADGQAFDMCPNIALGIVKGLPPSEALAGGSTLYEYDPAALSSLLAQLTLDTARVGHQAKCLVDRCTDKDSSYESPLKYENIPAEWRQSWTEALGRAEALGLHLPKENPFVPKDLSLKPLPEDGSPKEPVRLQCTNMQPVSVMYHRQDDTFKQPKATISFTIYTPFPMSSVENHVHAEMWCCVVSEALNEFAYDAAMAGVNYSLGLQSGAIGLTLGGFNDKLSVLLDAVMEKMRSMVEAPEMIYNICADAYLDEIRNMVFRSQPYNQCTMRYSELTARGSVFPSYKKYEAIQKMKREDLNNMPSKLFEQCHVEVLSTGNIVAEEVQSLSSSLVKGLQLKQPLEVLPEKAEAALPKGSTIWTLPSTDEDSPNHAVFLRIQLVDSVQTDMMLNLVNATLSSKFFDELRTKQQLGYIVGMQNSRSSNFNYLVAVVQTEFPPDFVRAQINDFLDQNFKFIEEKLDDVEFNTCLQGLLSDLRMKPKNLSEEFQRFAGPFADRSYDFSRRQRSIKFVESDACSLDAMKTFVREELKLAPRMYNQVNKVLAKEDKPLPEDSKIPVDPDSLRKWTKHQEVVDEFQKSAEWKVMNNRVEA